MTVIAELDFNLVIGMLRVKNTKLMPEFCSNKHFGYCYNVSSCDRNLEYSCKSEIAYLTKELSLVHDMSHFIGLFNITYSKYLYQFHFSWKRKQTENIWQLIYDV